MLLLTGFTLGCTVTIILVVVRDFWTFAVAKVFVLLLCVTCIFLLEPTVGPLIAPAWRYLAWDIMTMIPALFWLLCQLAFSDRPRIFSVWSAIAAYSFIAPALTRPFGASEETLGLLHTVGWQYPRYMEYLTILHGMWTVVANWSADLLEERRRLRGLMLGVVGSAAIWVTLTVNTGFGSAISLPLVICIAVLICAHLLLKGRDGDFFVPTMSKNEKIALNDTHGGILPQGKPGQSQLDALAAETTAITPEKRVSGDVRTLASVADAYSNVENRDILRLEEVMKEGFYRTERLTLQKLSKKLELPEYKTRALVNKSLGYRNFNDYVNHLRIAEASKRLIAEPNTPILNISLDIGYRTLSSFNRAFKDILDQTPTAYRQSQSSNDACVRKQVS